MRNQEAIPPQIWRPLASKSKRGGHLTAKCPVFYIKTFGCQMNEHDSARVVDLLLQDGYSLVEDPEDADVLLFNTCSVRKHAEDRVFGKLAELKKLKDKNHGIILGVLGCMAEAQKDFIFRKFPHVDFLCGPADLDRIHEIIDRVRSGAGHIMCLEGYNANKIPEFSKCRSAGKNAYVKIMEGCSNFCSYCIVPYVRGLERSRASCEILDEIAGLFVNKPLTLSLSPEGRGENGVEKITLLGQNVNSYGKGLNEKITFPGLLRKINDIVLGDCFALDAKRQGLAMTPVIDFVTSHPKDAGIELFKVMAECKSISKQLHLPLQSGSNRILKRMNRDYTVEKYKKLVRDFRKIVKHSAIMTDLIVGFPGETEKDFEDTLKAVKEIKFDAAYIFKYSPRPFTAASKMNDDVPKDEKERRHGVLLEIQKRVSLEYKSIKV